MVLTFKSVDKTLACDHSNESYWAVLSCGTLYYAVLGGLIKPLCVTIQMKAIEQYFHVVLFIMLYKVVLTFKSVDKTLLWPFKWKLLGVTWLPDIPFQNSLTIHWLFLEDKIWPKKSKMSRLVAASSSTRSLTLIIFNKSFFFIKPGTPDVPAFNDNKSAVLNYLNFPWLFFKMSILPDTK